MELGNGGSMVVVTAIGRDRPGLVAELTSIIAEVNGNIVDIEESVMRGLFTMFMIVDLSEATASPEELKERLVGKGREVGLQVSIEPYVPGRRKADKQFVLINVLGKDRPGIVAAISSLLRGYNVNIEKIRMIARGEMFAMEMLADISDLDGDLEAVKRELKRTCEGMGLSAVVQREDVFGRFKRLVVFDMDSTLVEQEIIDEIAKAAGVGEEVHEITRRAMEGEIDFKEALRMRVKLLAGIRVEELEKIARNMRLTPGARELIQALKAMGCKVALISGGFTYFTDKLKEMLGLDYAFGNKLIIKNGVLTGEVEEPIIDAERKAEIIEWIAENEGIGKDEIVAIGDGANDRFMLKNVGLGIAFNAKEILKQVADGVISEKNLLSILYALGIPQQNIEKYTKQNSK
ncbi:MAG: phosphoserine phosphatase SerB [Candidatus Freyarchaeota archaeon]|nr:phosphoserine phosphatase SerB [Candidatus Freyrarchaeum guaymaensis]